MSNINVFQKIFQPKARRTSQKRSKKPRNNKIYQLNGFKHLAFLKYEEDNLKHFGVFKNQTLTIKRFIEWKEIDNHSLYVVLLPDNSVRVCAIKAESPYKVTLHDGLGGNFATYYRFRLELVGLVLYSRDERTMK